VRIQFSDDGRITGAEIERYLLEKSRVTHRSPLERAFHVFYQLMSAPKEFQGILNFEI
jgi:myosin heavy subunit